MKILKRIFLGFLVVVSIPLMAYFVFGAKSYLEGQSLVTSSKLPSLYVFEFGSNRRVEINDPNNKFVHSWGDAAKSIEIENGVRIVTFVEPAMLKTEEDSIEPHADYVKLKGYMGITTKDTEFTVSPEGVISSNKWHGG
ncbi:hypothetical protein JNO04_04725 [Halomonas sp. MC140]|nr:hypothetical protein [Halomonas sp. MC140]MDN7131658.1 hypothetical protein [Halomonas sp. MC140]